MAATRQRRGDIPRATGTLALAQAMSHPLRVRIVTALNSPRRTYSPNQLAEEMQLPLGSISYHVRELKALGFLEQVETKRRRGAIEHFYRATERAAAWEAEWKRFPPAIKQVLAASALGLGVESLGRAIDSGSFEKRDDSTLGQDTFMSDERGAREAMAILTKTMEALIRVSERAEARLAETEDEGTPISYFLAGFEGSIAPL